MIYWIQSLKFRPRMRDFFRDPLLRLRLALLLSFAILAGGTCGYMLLERYNFLDALFMTVITLGSVGYGTVKPLDVKGEIFTIVLILFGLGTAAWLFTTIVETFVSEQTLLLLSRRRMTRMVNSFKDHYIVCGYGRIGQQIAQGYRQNGVPYVIIEQEPDRLEMMREADTPHVEGDAADDEVLERAGIDRAAALIAVTPTDAVNTFIVLSARGMRPDLYIVARADKMQNEAKLLRAGASKVVSPHVLGGRWMAITAINPAVTDFITAMTEADHTQFMVSEFVVAPGAACAGKTLGDSRLREQTGALVVALRAAGEVHSFVPNPPDTRRLASGDTLITIGSPDQLRSLACLLSPDNPQEIVRRGML